MPTKIDYEKINQELIDEDFDKVHPREREWTVIEDDFDEVAANDYYDDGQWFVPDGETEGVTGEFDEEGWWIQWPRDD